MSIAPAAPASSAARPEAKILFQSYFKSVGPRTYAAQVKEAGNGNQFIVLTESKRDDKSEEPRKTRLFIFSEDFEELFKLIDATAAFVRAHPVSPDVRNRQKQYWSKKRSSGPARSARP